MQLRLRNPTRMSCPPEPHFRYVFPEDGYPVVAVTYVDWVQAAKNHLAANNREIPASLEADMQHQLCLTLPPGWCMYDDPARPRPTVSLDWNDVAAGLKVFARWIMQGCNYVPQSEAERRALVCSRCYLNVNVQGCSGCGQAVQEIVRQKKTKLDPQLNSCAVCRCFLKAKVHFPLSTLDTLSEKAQQMYPEHCWLKQGGPNYDPSPLPH